MTDTNDPNPLGRTEPPAGPVPPTPRHRRVLLVDREPTLQPALRACAGERATVAYADSLAAARELVRQNKPFDLAVIDPDLADGSGLELANELAAAKQATQSVVVSSDPDFALAQRAMRAGASDYLVKQRDAAALVDAALLADRVRAALERQDAAREQAKRIRRLKKLCRQLDAAREEVSDQVDILCNDLVTAYQELAVQMQDAVHTTGFTAVIGEELDLEVVLRKTLEHLVGKAGPCNAAIFLPATMDEYSLGGYVNYDCPKESADMLLDHLADVLAPRVGECVDVIEAGDNAMLRNLLGDDWHYLADSRLVTFACIADDEPLAVVALFRDESQPFPPGLADACRSVADVLGEVLAKIIRVHHRAAPDDLFGEATEGEPIDDDTFLPHTEWEAQDSQPELFEDDEELEDDLPF